MKTSNRMFLILAALIGFAGLSFCESDSWPTFHGPNRDNISPDKGLLKSWPKDGPELLWKFDKCGKGFSSVSVAGGMIFTSGNSNDKTMITALDMDGNLLWQSENEAAWTDAVATATWKDGHASHPGARGTPVYSDGMLYQLNGDGRLAALDAKTGRETWFVDLKGDDIKGSRGTWGYAESATIDGNNLICTPGGKSLCIALDKKTGKQVWASTLGGKAAYASGLIADYKGTRMFITRDAANVVALDAKDGKPLWKFAYSSWYEANVTTPVFKDGYVYITTGYGKEDKLLKIDDALHSVTEVWSAKHLDNLHGGVVMVDGYVYGAGDRQKGWHCIEMMTGKEMWQAEGVGKSKGAHAYGSVTYADGMLYCYSESGIVALVQASPKEYKETGRFQLPSEGKDPFWNHPVVIGGRLYLRHENDLLVYSVKKEE